MKKKLLVSALVCAAFMMCTAAAHAGYVLFDDIVTTDGYGIVPTSYNGFTWNGFEVVTQAIYRIGSIALPQPIALPGCSEEKVRRG